VRPTRLALHFVFALGLISYAFWFALRLSVPAQQIARNNRLRKWSVVVLVVLFFQLLYGALMAGNKAATAAPTWPSINGSMIPESLHKNLPLVVNLVGNKITIHFIHRTLAYLLLILVTGWTITAVRVYKPGDYFRRSKWLPLITILVQVLLGITAVLSSTQIIPNRWGAFEWVAELHQITGMLFLLLMIFMLYIVRKGKPDIISAV
jgi:cytochrome c oxidase assembly protein subunit 15